MFCFQSIRLSGPMATTKVQRLRVHRFLTPALNYDKPAEFYAFLPHLITIQSMFRWVQIVVLLLLLLLLLLSFSLDNVFLLFSFFFTPQATLEHVESPSTLLIQVRSALSLPFVPVCFEIDNSFVWVGEISWPKNRSLSHSILSFDSQRQRQFDIFSQYTNQNNTSLNNWEMLPWDWCCSLFYVRMCCWYLHCLRFIFNLSSDVDQRRTQDWTSFSLFYTPTIFHSSLHFSSISNRQIVISLQVEKWLINCDWLFVQFW
jgi:hypothetical protein